MSRFKFTSPLVGASKVIKIWQSGAGQLNINLWQRRNFSSLVASFARNSSSSVCCDDFTELR